MCSGCWPTRCGPASSSALRDAGLVVAEPHGRFTYYRLQPDTLDAAANLTRLVAKARLNVVTHRACR
jgi:ArsR family transcriptional regulator, arsenate/arsenite/antimonite-responsive transcriptional repressor